MSKVINEAQFKALLHDNMRIMAGGFAGRGTAYRLLDLVVDSGIQNIWLLSEDFVDPGIATGRLIHTKQVRKFTGCHIGKNPDASKANAEGWLEVNLMPQGNFVEGMRCAGAGLGGVLTKTGLNTVIEEQLQKININGEDWLIQTPIHADIALVRCHHADEAGNLVWRGTTANFNCAMAMAADITVVECDEIVPCGTIPPNQVTIPGVYVNYILEGGSRNHSIVDGVAVSEKQID
jgi:acetate CoA/acetoacetate CoA-transferase alpha subunit